MISRIFQLFFVLGLSCVACQTPIAPAESETVNATSPPQQEIRVGDGCDGCELLFEGMPQPLTWATSLSPSAEPGEPMHLTGTVYQPDGKTPAAGIILYAYHTDHQGIYSPSAKQTAGRKHGHLRGWVQTDKEGRFEWRSIRPAAYPERKFAAHIHVFVKEPGKSVYWIDEVWFEDDPLLTPEVRKTAPGRGGNLILKMSKDKGIWVGHLNITLGLKVPNYQ